MDDHFPHDIIATIDEMFFQQSPLYHGEPLRICGHCDAVFGELDMILHIHFGHQLEESHSCPCHECKTAALKRPNRAVGNAGAFAPSGATSSTTASDDVSDEACQMKP